jgi:hypothetical protein
MVPVAPNGVDRHIRWIKPREPWLLNRVFTQCGELAGNVIEGLARQMEAAAQATSLEDLFDRLTASEQLLRVDERVAPTMYRGPTVSARELEQLRRIEDVVRLGKVRRIERTTIVLEQGTVPTSAEYLRHCAAGPNQHHVRSSQRIASRCSRSGPPHPIPPRWWGRRGNAPTISRTKPSVSAEPSAERAARLGAGHIIGTNADYLVEGTGHRRPAGARPSIYRVVFVSALATAVRDAMSRSPAMCARVGRKLSRFWRTVKR